MIVSPDQILDGATPQARGRFDPAAWPPIAALVGTVLVSACLTLMGGKSIPGGPFISLHADAAPALMSVGLVAASWRSLRHGPLWRRLTVAVIVLCAVAVFFLVLAAVGSFWLDPYARGTMVSW